MLRKIRRFYWKQRDRGLGRQTVMAAVGAALFLMIILGAVTKSVIMPKNESRKNAARTETASGTAIGAEAASGGGVAIEGVEASVDPDDETTDYTADDSNNDVSVDMTDLEPFLGFMSETAYDEKHHPAYERGIRKYKKRRERDVVNHQDGCHQDKGTFKKVHSVYLQ